MPCQTKKFIHNRATVEMIDGMHDQRLKMAVSEKIKGFMEQSSWIRRMFEDGVRMKQEFGADRVYDFSLGNPNIAPPECFRKILKEVGDEEFPGCHGYMPNAGFMETRAAVAAHVGAEQGVPLTAAHIVMSCGAAAALNVVLKTLLNPGEKVIVPAPYFAEYRFYIDNAGGVMCPVPTAEDLSLDDEVMEWALDLNPGVKAVLINSPNNPTGKVYSKENLAGLIEVLTEKSRARGREIYLIADEPYRDIVYDGVRPPQVLSAYPNSIVVSSYSKSLSLPGERIGYIAVHPEITPLAEIMDGMVLCNRILGFVNAPALMQRVVARLQGARVDVDAYRRKRDLLCDGLTAQGYTVYRPEGAFYLFPKTPLEDDVAFVRLLQKKRILAVPGIGFGRPGHMRIAYCVGDETILNAMEGFGEALHEARGLGAGAEKTRLGQAVQDVQGRGA